MKRSLTILWLAFLGIISAATLASAGPISADSATQTQNSKSKIQNPIVPATPVPCNVVTGRVVASPNNSTAPIVSSLNGITVIGASDVWAVGTYRDTGGADRTLIQHWDGTEWSLISSPNVGTGGNYLLEVSGSAANDVWAVGRAIGVGAISLHWDGTQWSNVTVPNLGSVSSNLQGVKAFAADNVWAAGSFGHAGQEQTVTIRWDGTQWLVIASPVLGSMTALLDVDGMAANDIWAVGKYKPTTSSPEQTLTIHWNGVAWTVVASPNVAGIANSLHGVSMVSASDVWAVGTYDTDVPKNLVLHYNGSSWSTTTSSGDGTFAEVVAVSASDVWAVGSDYNETTGDTVPISGHWNGSSWTQQSAPAIGANMSALYSVAKGPSNVLWAVGKGRTPSTTVDEAYVARRTSNQWTVVPDETDGSMMNVLNGIAALSPNDIWAVGSTGASSRTLIEHWNGATWSIIPSPNVEPAGSVTSYLTAVSGTSANNVWAVGYSKSGMSPEQTLIMRWNGSMWNIVASPNVGTGANSLYGVDALTSNDAWAVGHSSAGEPLAMRWNGTAWTVVTTPTLGSDAQLMDVEALAANDAWAVGSYRVDGSSPYRTLALRWDGAAWTQVATPNSGSPANYLRAISVVTANDAWAVGYAGQAGSEQAITLHWNGTAWSQVSTGFTAQMSALYDVDVAAANSVWAVGSFINGGGEQTLIMRWDGSRWNVVGSPNANTDRNVMHAIAVAATNDIWGVGQYADAASTLTLAERFGPATFSDVPTDNTFYSYVQCLVCRGIVNGYSDGTFRPNNNVTRGQLSKIVSNAAGYSEAPGAQRFEDIAPGHPFYDWINRLASRGHIGGYVCGGEGEPCGAGNLPYFRPGNNATRGQISKIVSNAAGYNDPPSSQSFEDVPPGSTFYDFVFRLSSRGVIGGYPCGGPGEPCGPNNLPYFRPGNNATRGQSSKIVANSFFPGCQTR